MAKTPVPADAQAPAPTATADPQLSYMEWVAGEIKGSKWYVGDGGFVAQALTAETLEEATATGELTSGRDTAGTRYRFLSATFADSDLDGSLPFYAVCDAVDVETGEVVKWACGGSRVVATLFQASRKDWFPFEAEIAAVNMGDGKNALNLVLSPAKVKSAASF